MADRSDGDSSSPCLRGRGSRRDSDIPFLQRRGCERLRSWLGRSRLACTQTRQDAIPQAASSLRTLV